MEVDIEKVALGLTSTSLGEDMDDFIPFER